MNIDPITEPDEYLVGFLPGGDWKGDYRMRSRADEAAKFYFLASAVGVIFMPTNVAPLNPRSANKVPSNSGMLRSVHVCQRNTQPNMTFQTRN